LFQALFLTNTKGVDDLEIVKIISAVIGPLCVIAASIGYIQSIRHGETRPHRVGWTIWFVATVVGFYATAKGHAGLSGLLVPATYVVIELVIAALAWTDSFGWKQLDSTWEKALIPVAVCSTLAWPLLPLNIGVWVAIIGDSLAAFYTLRKTVDNPRTEPIWPWALSCVGAIFGVVALQNYYFTASAFPVYLVLQTGLTTLLVVWARGQTRQGKKQSAA
jgi:Ca2+/Na+ antiporter